MPIPVVDRGNPIRSLRLGSVADLPRKVVYIKVDSPCDQYHSCLFTPLFQQPKHPTWLKFDSTTCSQQISSQTRRDLYYTIRMSWLGNQAAPIAIQPKSGTCSPRMGGK